MAVKKFRFVSPGVFVNEIDNSGLPASPAGIGPAVIGRASSGPGLRPITVNSFSEFVNVFGAPVAGGSSDDVWRDGNTVGPTYGMYAAQAYLRNSSPLTYVRLLGAENPDATSAGKAGWKVDVANGTGQTDGVAVLAGGANGCGAYGLVIFNSGAANGPGVLESHAVPITGALAAIFYIPSASNGTANCSFALSGAMASNITAGNNINVTGASSLIVSTVADSSYEFKMLVRNATGSSDTIASFNFNRSSNRYIRKVFNTNPQLTNRDINTNVVNYWLGPTFDRHLPEIVTAAASNNYYAALVPLLSGSNNSGDYQAELLSAETPWIISQDLTNNFANYSAANMQKLFKIVALDEPGAWTSRNIKISIQEVKASTNDFQPYGSFAVVVRRLDDSDNVVEVLEQFNDCNLNPNSLNYLARKIGDRNSSWDATNKRYRVYGQYDNRSRYIRVNMNSDVDNGVTDAKYLPFGFVGIPKYRDFTFTAGGTGVGHSLPAEGTTSVNSYIASTSSAYLPATGTTGTNDAVRQYGRFITSYIPQVSGSIKFPTPVLRVSSSDGSPGNNTDAYWGLTVGRSGAPLRYDESTVDLLNPLGALGSSQFDSTAAGLEASTAFTLDDVVQTSANNAYWASGARVAGIAHSVSASGPSGDAQTWSDVLTAGWDRFTVPMHGGFDGLDITESEPFRNNAMVDSTELTYAPNNSIKRAIDSLADPEVMEMNLATIPGLTNEGLTSHLINTCEDRADALAIIDLKGGYVPKTENNQSFSSRVGSSTTTVDNLKARGLNSSYGCAYYPWVQIRDSINGALLWVPPSVAALGTFSSSQRKSQVWFAPAGFNRGGLTVGAAGVPVVNVVEKLTRQQRDDLYAANINPIAKFPAEGIVVFGQKTLQVTQSALDRINVRRLMIFVKKRISQIAAQLLFEPNVQQTWDRFVGQATPFLDEVKTNFGLSDYLLVLDETTTTPDLIDRNILYAQIFLKPTRAIEFIALDFNITRTGASFVD
jgi:hypothetical protein